MCFIFLDFILKEFRLSAVTWFDFNCVVVLRCHFWLHLNIAFWCTVCCFCMQFYLFWCHCCCCCLLLAILLVVIYSCLFCSVCVLRCLHFPSSLFPFTHAHIHTWTLFHYIVHDNPSFTHTHTHVRTHTHTQIWIANQKMSKPTNHDSSS